jgi:hypothetical protein
LPWKEEDLRRIGEKKEREGVNDREKEEKISSNNLRERKG